MGIASGFISLRTRGGFLPERWPQGIKQAERFKRDGRRATVIDIPFAPDKASEGKRSLKAFREAAAWLPAFARRIRRIEVPGGSGEPEVVDCTISPLPGQDAIDVIIARTSARTQRALRFDLGDGHSLLLAVDHDGPCAFPNALARIWNLAPLEEDLRSDWLLNGPFAVDPGRGRLAGSVSVRQKRFRKLGQALGERLLELYDLTADWTGVAKALALDASAQRSRPRFWQRLFDVVKQDFDDDLARCLHARDRGYGRLATERPATPTGLPAPFDALVRASDVRHSTSGALADSTVLAQVSHWPGLAELEGRIVARGKSERLTKIGFCEIQPIALADLLRCGMAEEGRIDADAAARFGKIVTLTAIEKEPLHQERKEILDAVRQAKFRARDDAWRPVKELNFESGSEDERLICGFAPASALLHDGYDGASLEFFKVARSTSGYGPRVESMCAWAARADDPDHRKAVLRYVISGRQGGEMAHGLRDSPPAWLHHALDRLRSDPPPDDWSEKDRERLLFELGRREIPANSQKITPRPTDGYDSNSEAKIGETLKMLEIDFQRGIVIKDDEGKLHPDFFFTTHGDDGVIWEHLGMWNAQDSGEAEKYRETWEKKEKRYKRLGYHKDKTLFTTKSIDAPEIVHTALRIKKIKDQPKVYPTIHASPRHALEKLYDWWDDNNKDERDAYVERAYPAFFSPVKLRGRTSWFTMFALACFQSFGRAQEGQHRGFIDRGYREGWWRAIAESIPPDEIQPWLTRLERWSGAGRLAQDFLLWKRTFVDLYTIARWLTAYTEVFLKLPRIVRERGPVSLNDVLRPSHSSVIGPLGLDAAPLDRSLGIGVNWLIRELARNGVYCPEDAESMAPYCWMPSRRVRKVLDKLGMRDLSPNANKEDSRAIYAFVVDHLDEERARFGGDFDLPLQLVTRAGNSDVLRQCFQQGGLDAPDFDESDDEAEDDLAGGDPA